MAGTEVIVEQLTVTRVRPGQPPRSVVEDLTFRLEPGKRLVLVGPNGAGKTTVLHAMVGALSFSGSIRYGGELLSEKTLAAVRRRVGFVFADPSEQFFLPSAREEVEFGPLQHDCTREEARLRGRAALAAVGLAELEDARPSELSLGEQRRLALATVLSCSPEVVLLDEPTAALDPLARQRVLAAIAATGATLVMATHDLEAARELGALVGLLNGGRLLAKGHAVEILADRSLLVRAGLAAP